MSLIPLEEAAQMLGISIEDLTELRSNGKIHGMRDGKTWKFKAKEIERYKTMHQSDVTDVVPKPGESSILSGSSPEVDADLDILVDVNDDDEKEVIDDAGVGIQSSSSSTIIGAPKIEPVSVGDSEELIDLGDADDVELSLEGGSELKLADGSAVGIDGEGLNLEASGIDLEGSDLKLEGSDLTLGGSDLNLSDEVSIDDDIELGAGGSEIKLAGTSDIQLDAGGSDLLLDPADGGSDAGATGVLSSIKPDASSDINLDEGEIDLEEALNLSDEDLELSVGSSSEVSLDGSDLSLAASDTGITIGDGSDVTLDASGSGINLDSPSDSGISLDETPQGIDLSGDSLELGEADELVDLGEGLIDDDDLRSDDDFLLSPSESDLGEDDSGSQVIALDTEELDDDAGTLVGDGDDGFETFDAADDDVGVAPIASVGAPAEFTIMNVLALGMIVGLLGITGVLTLDLVRNIWSWQGEYAINSPIMDFIIGMFGG